MRCSGPPPLSMGGSKGSVTPHHPLPSSSQSPQRQEGLQGGEAAGQGLSEVVVGSAQPQEPEGWYLGFSTLQPVVEENVIGAGKVSSKGVLPDRGVWGLVQVGEVLQGTLTKVLQGCNDHWDSPDAHGSHRCPLWHTHQPSPGTSTSLGHHSLTPHPLEP